MRRVAAANGSGRLAAILGPTNTGKTHMAVERMLGHATGVIGLPLRLLAREIYDRVVASRGARSVALVTGEEKIVPPNPAYFVCTVESMPTARQFDFLAVDEIQLCADPERGHVFTDRLLHARGRHETLFLGADTIRPLLGRLLPEAEMVTRPRFSTLSYVGARKLSRLRRRSAVVAFSADDVYAIAELMRRQRGGAAVVLGALSPRTRNAQVAMFQAGEVDFLVATDAIGMGLNMDIDHIAFAAMGKFDGAYRRPLSAAEIGQIAGRAGRHMNDGTFGTSAEVGELDAELVGRVENHQFERLKQLHWRNSDLSFRSLPALIGALEEPPPRDFLIRAREATDYTALRGLARDEAVAAHASGPAAVGLLWEVCRIPDFRKTLHDQHIRLLARVYRHLTGPESRLPTDWVARQVDPLSRTEGDIDTLSARIAHIRTWTYISHRDDWLADAVHWQERTRAIEDQLSDALHERLTQRFVDRRSALLMGRLKDRDELLAAVNRAGELHVEGQYVGRLRGLGFVAEADGIAEGRAVRAAVNRVLGGAVAGRARQLAQSPDDAFELGPDGRIRWDGAAIARLAAGDDVLRPRLNLLPNDHLDGPEAERVKARLAAWLDDRVKRLLAPLVGLSAVPFTGPGRGVAFQLIEALGVLARQQVAPQLKDLDAKDFGRFKYNGVKLGQQTIFVPALLKPAATGLRLQLWAARAARDPPPAPPPAGLVSCDVADGVPSEFYLTAGYRVFGGRAVRVDMLERLADLARRAAGQGRFACDHEMMGLVGCARDDFIAVMAGLGYQVAAPDDGADPALAFTRKPRPKPKGGRKRRVRSAPDADSPFAALRQLDER